MSELETPEIWRSTDQLYRRFEVSSQGRIRNVKDGALRKPYVTSGGYPYISAQQNSNVKTAYIHRMVFEAFNGPIPDGMCINHIDGCKTNNAISNLECVSLADNNQHARKLGLNRNYGERHRGAKLTDIQVAEIRSMADAGARTRDLVRLFGIKKQHVADIKFRRKRVSSY